MGAYFAIQKDKIFLKGNSTHTLNLIINDSRTANNCDLDNPIFDLNDNDFYNYTSRQLFTVRCAIKAKVGFCCKNE
jgi:hypothetical protein